MSCPSLSTIKIWAQSNFRPLPRNYEFVWFLEAGTLKKLCGFGSSLVKSVFKLKLKVWTSYTEYILNFSKNCILSCLLKFDKNKWFYRDAFEIKAHKYEIKDAFSNLLCHKNDTNCKTMIGQYLYFKIVTSTDKKWSKRSIKIYVLKSAGTCFHPP